MYFEIWTQNFNAHRRGIELDFQGVHMYLGLRTTTASREVAPWSAKARRQRNCLKLFHASPPCSLSSQVHQNCSSDVQASRAAGGAHDFAHGLAVLKAAAEGGAFDEWTMEASIHRPLTRNWDE